MTYRAIGSGSGLQEFGCETGSTEDGDPTYGTRVSQFTAVEKICYVDEGDDGDEVAHIPFLVGGIGIFVNLPELREEEDRGIVLNRDMLKRIFSGDVTKWSVITCPLRCSV